MLAERCFTAVVTQGCELSEATIRTHPDDKEWKSEEKWLQCLYR